MNPLGELLSAEDIRLDFDAASAEPLLEEIAATLARRQRLPRAEILASLLKREQLGSTGLGHGVAIPHARMDQCSGAAAALVRTRAPVPFGAPDGRPASLFLGLIVPKQANERHLQLLATAAAMFDDRNFRRSLLACADAAAMKDLIVAWPGTDHAAPPECSTA